MKLQAIAIRTLGIGLTLGALSGCVTGYHSDIGNSAVKHENAKLKAYAEPRKYHFPSSRQTGGKKTFVFDPRQHAWAAYNASGHLVADGIASGGQNYCSDIGRACKTPRGSFRVTRKGGPDCKSSKYPLGKGGAPMPNCMFFYRGFAIHGSYDVPNRNASHGCVRVTPEDSAWLANNFMDIGTVVKVTPY